MEVKQGYKETEVGVIPEDWEVARLKDLTSLITDGAHLSPPTDKNGYPIATVENINNGYIDIDSCRVISSKDFQYLVRNNCKPSIGDVLLSKDGTIGITFPITKEVDVVLLSSIAIIRPQKDKLDSIFLSKSFSSEWFYLFLDRVKAGSALTRIVLRDISKYIFAIPPTIEEQTAIATALSDADALINSLEKLIAKKRNIKQGAMQQLLKPKEGWELKKLGEVIYLQGGYAFKSDLFTNVGIPIIRISDVENNKVDTDNSVCYEPFNIPEEFVAKKGDVLIAMSGATTGKIGVYNYDGIAYINQRVGKFVVLNENETSQEFISHIVCSLKFKENLTKEIAQGAQPNISGKQIQSIVLPIPNDKEEQNEIATILSDMDAEIQALETKLEKYRNIKLGMMQNLLTGKIRLV